MYALTGAGKNRLSVSAWLDLAFKHHRSGGHMKPLTFCSTCELTTSRGSANHNMTDDVELRPPQFTEAGLGCLVWQDVAHRVMVVTPQGHSEVKRFWKRQKSHT
ncbi:general transcription factor IIH subunit 4 [Lates japonicus]|uniref:General transcription factor IIH subunit 4 n=1 Tax=Lates japonicus TaxID=270547 RepID=A0AAD3MZV6_LATJO|nr:general transcription factor IIH subunit 4 [Lates japonicus]